MLLFSTESLQCFLRFERQSHGISAMAWIDNVSGDIVTSSSKVGALKIWNAAHETNKDMIKVGP